MVRLIRVTVVVKLQGNKHSVKMMWNRGLPDPLLHVLDGRRKVGAGRMCRELGQVRKEAAVVNFRRVRCSAFHPSPKMMLLQNTELFRAFRGGVCDDRYGCS